MAATARQISGNLEKHVGVYEVWMDNTTGNFTPAVGPGTAQAVITVTPATGTASDLGYTSRNPGTGLIGMTGAADNALTTCTGAGGQPVISTAAAATAHLGRAVVGTNVPVGSHVIAVSAGASVTLNQNLSGTVGATCATWGHGFVKVEIV